MEKHKMEEIPFTFLNHHKTSFYTYHSLSSKEPTISLKRNEIDIELSFNAQKSFKDGESWSYLKESNTKSNNKSGSISRRFFKELLENGFVWVKFINPSFEYYESIVKLTFYNSFFPLKKTDDASIQTFLQNVKKYRLDYRNPIYYDMDFNGSIMSKFEHPENNFSMDDDCINKRTSRWGGFVDYRNRDLFTKKTTALFFDTKPILRIPLDADEDRIIYYFNQYGKREDINDEFEECYRRNIFRNNTDGFVWLPDYSGSSVIKKNTRSTNKIYPSYKGFVTPDKIVDILGEMISVGDSVFYSANDKMIMSNVVEIDQNYIYVKNREDKIRITFNSEKFLKITDNMYESCVFKKLIS